MITFGFIFWTDVSPRHLETLRLKEAQMLSHCTGGKKCIWKQILYDSTQTPRVDKIPSKIPSNVLVIPQPVSCRVCSTGIVVLYTGCYANSQYVSPSKKMTQIVPNLNNLPIPKPCHIPFTSSSTTSAN